MCSSQDGCIFFVAVQSFVCVGSYESTGYLHSLLFTKIRGIFFFLYLEVCELLRTWLEESTAEMLLFRNISEIIHDEGSLMKNNLSIIKVVVGILPGLIP